MTSTEEIPQQRQNSDSLDAGMWHRQRSLIPERYGDPAASGLTFEVKRGERNVASLELTSKP